MADAVVSFAIENVGNFLIQEGKLLSGVRDEVEELQIELRWMQGFLRDAGRRKGESHMLRNWVFEIRETTYDVEDLIEHFALRSALRNQKGAVNRIKKYVFFINPLVELHQVGSRIKSIKARLTILRTRLQIYGIKELKVGVEEDVADGAFTTGRRRQDYSHVVDHNVVGLDEKITELVERLIHVGGQHDHDDSPAPASVVCLHGMGGVGKTTTAKKVYYDSRIRAHFEGFAWVYISQQCNPRQVWESILTQLSNIKEAIKSMSDDELTSELCDLQKDKRCLLVIDDIWNHQDWVNLSAAFTYMDHGSKSKMLLTTRNEGVASHGVHVYGTNLNVLNHSNSLDLLTNTIEFLGGSNHPIKEDSNMKKYAGEMVKQCGGLPLAIIVLGGILATKHELIKWERVGADIKLVLKGGEQEGNDGLLSVLVSSYEDLPYRLRSCFLYFSYYREDEEIKTTELKQKWIGEGFVSPSVQGGDETMEDIAEEYLHELVRRCMIQVGRKGHTGRVKTCRIHDLMRDMCISKAKEEGFSHTIKLGVGNEGTNFNQVSFRRLCISLGNDKLGESVLSSLERISPHLRSIWFQDNFDDDQCKEAVLIVMNLKLVRVLELLSTMWTLMGKSGREHVGNLIHLRFLNLEVLTLPTSIGNLICLQTLNLGRCNSNLKIPDSVWRMEQLRHLYLPRDGGVCESGQQLVGCFLNLQTLVNFPPKNFDLQQNLVKFIHVRKLVIAKRCEEICKILGRSPGMVFNKLESLSFTHSSENVDLEAVTRNCPCLYRLLVVAPITSWSVLWPSNLTKLVLRNSGLDESHMRSLGKLQRLKVLFLYGDAFRGKQMIFHQNDFPQLHHLILLNLKNLKAWAVQEGGLPNLSCLEIVNCWELQSLGDGAQYLKKLKELKVRSMPYMFRKRLEEGGEDWDRVRNVPSISFSYCYPELEIDDHTNSDILDENSSLELLNKTILFFGGPDHPIRENSEMDTSTREMVKLCEGVPLAITILGRVLARKHEMKEWESIESVMREGGRKGNDGVTSLLELSYEDLPCNLKPCFLYFGQYLKDEELKTTEMIQRWIGEGFLTSMDETMEDVGQEHLNELASRRLIQVRKRSHTGRVKTCRMHEFVWHFCVSKAKEEGFAHSLKLGVGDEGPILEKVKFSRLCISSGGSSYKVSGSIMSSLVQVTPHLISIRFPDDLDEDKGEAVVLIVKNLKLVKVLTFPRIIWSLLDESGREHIGNLVNLTFLKLEGSELPKSLGNLRCLQTLNLERCVEDMIIPDSVWGMEQLRHLYLPKRGSVCESSRQQVGDFLNLQTLINFPPHNFDLQRNLVKFSNVRKLVIIKKGEKMDMMLRSQEIVFNRLQSLSYTDSTYGEVDLKAFTRGGCPCLYRLFVKGSIEFPAAPSCTVIWPSNLTKLVLRCTNIDQSQLGSLAKLPSLKVLFLQWNAFAGKEIVFHKNDFPQLHHLILQNLKDLKAWAVHEGGLPSLSCLEIVKCWELQSLGDGVQYLKRLKELKVRSMSYMFRKRLEEGGEDWDRVRNVPSISFSYCYPELEIYYHTSSDILDENSSLEILYKTILVLEDPDLQIRENSEMNTSAINVLGKFLARKQEMKEWQSIESVRREGNDVFSSMLEFSYEDLPCNLKSCFLYFGHYLKGEEIKATEIIQRWIGEGFVMSSMEDVGEEYLNELVTRCLVQVGKRSHRGRVKTCRMHEFVWNFCVSKAKEEGFAHTLQLGVGDEETILEKVQLCRLCISSHGRSIRRTRGYFPAGFLSSLAEISPQLISLQFTDNPDGRLHEAAWVIVNNLKLVKVLTLPSLIWSLLEESERERIGNLANLTFLKLEGSKLPKSFGNLRCLQTLNLEKILKNLIIPDSVWGMEQLRHLYLPEGGSVCETSWHRAGDFLNLQTLVNFPPSKFDLRRNLGKFSNVRKLVIIEKSEEMGRILRSQDIMFNRLQSLSVTYIYGQVDLEAFTRGCPSFYRLFVEGSIKFPAAPSCTSVWPSNLTKLVLRSTKIDHSQLGSLAKLQSLKVLFLQQKAFVGKEMVFHKNHFLQLHHLVIERLEHLETWAVHEGALSNLLCLEIRSCDKLKSIPDGSQYLKQLKDLKVVNMPSSFIKRLEEGGEDWDRVSHVPSISFIDGDRL